MNVSEPRDTSYDPSASVSSPLNTLNDTHPSTPEHAGDRLSLTNAEMGILAQACRTLQFSSRFFISLLAKNIDPTFHLQYFIRRTCENTPDIITLIFLVILFERCAIAGLLLYVLPETWKLQLLW